MDRENLHIYNVANSLGQIYGYKNPENKYHEYMESGSDDKFYSPGVPSELYNNKH